MFLFPPAIAPPAPFPLVTAQSVETEFVAPGVTRARYHLRTSAGPVVVTLVAADPHQPHVRVDAVTSGDRIVSGGETVRAMATRTGAVAGINADYFDIGQTNQPLGIVVRRGELERTPSARVALAVRRDGTSAIETFGFTGTVDLGGVRVPLAHVNVWPADGTVALLTRAFGAIPAVTGGVKLLPLVSATANTYTWSGTARDAQPGAPIGGPVLAFGAGAVPAADFSGGGTATVSIATTPPFDDLVAAVGGGPILLRDRTPVNDPEGPPLPAGLRIPIAGIGEAADGTLLLAAVDGRKPLVSIGMTRAELGAFFASLGATDAMSVDSGGSATLVARVLGEAAPSVLNTPSDGKERPVADGLFIYSTAPVGPPARLVVRPAPILALAGAHLSLARTQTDAAGHFLGTPVGAFSANVAPAAVAQIAADGDLRALAPGSATARIRVGALATDLPVTVVSRLAALTIDPSEPNPDPGGTLRFHVTGIDPSGRNVIVGDAARFTASGGAIAPDGTFRAGARDAMVAIDAGGVHTVVPVRVGRHDEPLDIADPRLHWAFATVPANGPGSATLVPGSPAILALSYDFTGSTRAAYANVALPLTRMPVRLALDIDGDGSGVGVRAVTYNALEERTALTLATRVDWHGWRRIEVALPAQTVRLTSLYAVGTLGPAPVRVAGTLRFRNVQIVVPGSGT